MINLEKIFRKKLRKELRKYGCSWFQSWKLEKDCSKEMIHNAIGEFVSPKDFALAITQ